MIGNICANEDDCDNDDGDNYDGDNDGADNDDGDNDDGDDGHLAAQTGRPQDRNADVGGVELEREGGGDRFSGDFNGRANEDDCYNDDGDNDNDYDDNDDGG